MPRVQSKIRVPSELEMNVNLLKELLDDRRITRENRERIQNIINMYKSRSIRSFSTASKIAKLLASRYSQSQEKGIKLYNKIFREVIKIRVILYRKERDHEINNIVRRRKYLNRLLPDYKAYWIGYVNVLSNSDDILKFYDKVIKRPAPNSSESDKHAWGQLISILRTNQDVQRYLDENDSGDGVDAVLIVDYQALSNTAPLDPLQNRQREVDKIMTHFKYTARVIDMTANNLREAIENGHCRKYHRNNECWVNALYDHYSHRLLNPEKKRCLITREIIYDIIGKTEHSVREGLNIHDMLPFFEKYQIPVRMYGTYRELLYKYDPFVNHRHNPPFYVLNDGDHIYTLDHELKSLQQRLEEEGDKTVLTVSNNYYINPNPKPIKYIMINDIDDLFIQMKEINKNNTTDEGIIINAIHRGDDLPHLLWQIVKENKYIPHVEFTATNITDIGLSFNSNKIMVFIKQQQLVKNEIDGIVKLENAQTYNNLSQTFTDFKFKILRNEHKSYYNQQDIDIMNECRTLANCGLMDPITNISNLVEIDMSKAYSSAFAKITKIPIFNNFDIWQPYEGEEIKNFHRYVVKYKEFNVFFNRTINVCYGQFLKYFPRDKVEILYVKKPSMIANVNYKEVIDELYSTKISDDENENKQLQKTVANTIIGLLEKSINRATKSKIFTDLATAKHYQIQFGGEITEIKQYEEIKKYIQSPLDYNTNSGESVHFEADFTGEKLYILTQSVSATLHNGFHYVKDLVLEHHNFAMYRAISKLRQHNISIFSIKTDALTIRSEHLELAKELLDFSPGIGKWRHSKTGADIKFPTKPLHNFDNKLIQISKPEINNIPITIEQEYDTEYICKEIVEKHRTLLIRARYAGSGKSYICEFMRDLGHKVLFVCPTNELAEKYGEDGITINRFFGFGISAEDNKFMHRFNASEYDTIVFDEIFFNSVKVLTRVLHYVNKNKDKIIIATGDTQQLPPVEASTNQFDYKHYLNFCADQIFPNQIFLEDIKRIKDPMMKALAIQIYDKLLSCKSAKQREQLVKKYFKFTKSVINDNNVAYRNATCKSVSLKVRKMKGIKEEYIVGDILICRIRFQLKKTVFNKNFKYVVSDVSNKTITLDHEHEVPIATVRTNFIYEYCRTAHQLQGKSIEKPITIFDWKFHRVTNEWLYVAISRCTDLNNVSFHEYAESDDNVLLQSDYFNKRIEGYKKQDREAKRKINKDNYVNVQWFLDNLGNHCMYCNEIFEFECEDGNITCNLTADRKRNDLDHNLENIQPVCWHCNSTKSNRIID